MTLHATAANCTTLSRPPQALSVSCKTTTTSIRTYSQRFITLKAPDAPIGRFSLHPLTAQACPRFLIYLIDLSLLCRHWHTLVSFRSLLCTPTHSPTSCSAAQYLRRLAQPLLCWVPLSYTLTSTPDSSFIRPYLLFAEVALTSQSTLHKPIEKIQTSHGI